MDKIILGSVVGHHILSWPPEGLRVWQDFEPDITNSHDKSSRVWELAQAVADTQSGGSGHFAFFH